MLGIKHIRPKGKYTSVASLKTVSDQKFKDHNQKILKPLVPIMAIPLLRSFPQHQLVDQGR
jgi:hypothetical protein